MNSKEQAKPAISDLKAERDALREALADAIDVLARCSAVLDHVSKGSAGMGRSVQTACEDCYPVLDKARAALAASGKE